MNSESWIAKRLYSTQQADGSRRSRPAVRVALAGIIIGVMVMLLTVCVVVGFKQTITVINSFVGSYRLVAACSYATLPAFFVHGHR